MLKALMLKRQLDAKRSELAALTAKDSEFETREADLESAIDEVEPGNAEQEAAVNAEIEKYEADKAAHDEAKQTLSTDIENLEAELEDIERKAPAPRTPEKSHIKRGDDHMETTINIRSLPMNRRAFDALPMERREAILAQPDTKEFLSQLRSMKGQNRSITGAELTIPVVFLDLIAENMYRYSKLLNRVRVRNVTGQARQTIAGLVPEAVWTEMCGAINELNFMFNQVTVDGYKVAGFIAVCNSILEDNDINLAGWIVEMLSESIGLAMDKAILYGKGSASKMPLGIVTRLAQQSQPSDYPANAPAWTDLHTTNVLQIGGAGVTGPASAIRAIAAGKVAAANIDEHLGFQHEIKVELDIPAPRLNNRAPHGRINTTEREACERRCDFEDIECGLTEEGARTEASRCLRCDHYGYGIFRGGRNEKW